LTPPRAPLLSIPASRAALRAVRQSRVAPVRRWCWRQGVSQLGRSQSFPSSREHVTWNSAHIANAQLRPRIEEVCRHRGFRPPVLCTPDEQMGKSDDRRPERKGTMARSDRRGGVASQRGAVRDTTSASSAAACRRDRPPPGIVSSRATRPGSHPRSDYSKIGRHGRHMKHEGRSLPLGLEN
jgi:hypothetical protein